MYWGDIGIMENKMEPSYMGIMEKETETTWI